jgi:WhiB family redox-sensing transcriptional regulator
VPASPIDLVSARQWPPVATRTDLACDTENASAFYSPDSRSWWDYGPALAICRRCPARLPCLAWALDTEQRHGVWGGTTPTDRAFLLSDLARE